MDSFDASPRRGLCIWGSDPGPEKGCSELGTTEEREILLTERDLAQIERTHPNGLTSAQIISIFQSRGARLSEATFRKYVQLGLLPRCRRVGTKGKHRGSHGIYPCATVRRINSIKKLMASSYTIEQIQRSFNNFKQQIEQIEAAIDDLFKGFEREIAKPHFDNTRRRSLGREIATARKTATELVRQIVQIETQVVLPEKHQKVALNDAARPAR
jgi:hypothetical protein